MRYAPSTFFDIIILFSVFIDCVSENFLVFFLLFFFSFISIFDKSELRFITVIVLIIFFKNSRSCFCFFVFFEICFISFLFLLTSKNLDLLKHLYFFRGRWFIFVQDSHPQGLSPVKKSFLKKKKE